MHCSDAPVHAVCPVDCFYRTDDGVVLHDKDLCIGCGYCFYACPFGAPQFPQAARSACAARWTSARSAPAVRSPTNPRRSSESTGAIVSPRQAAGVRRNVLDQGIDRRRRRRARGDLSDARDQSWSRQRSVGLGNRVRATRGAEAARRGARHRLRPRRPPEGPNRDPARDRHGGSRVGRSGARGLRRAAAGRQYKQGKYQGKPDTAAYASAPWNGNKQEWEQALATRNQNQNEYKRIR
jgi:NAD-dependent dihydropyrimidine dehydrogenase PreA subunit